MTYILLHQKQQGPFSEMVLTAMAEDGTIGPETLAWHDGMVEWVPLRQLRSIGSTETSAGTPPNAHRVGPQASRGIVQEKQGSAHLLPQVTCQEEVAATLAVIPAVLLTEAGEVVEDGVDWCVFHAANGAMAFGLSWIGYVFFNAWLSTSTLLWGRGQYGDALDGIFRVPIHDLTGFEEPWFCCFLLGLGVTFLVGAFCIPAGFLQAVFTGKDENVPTILAIKALQSATHVVGFGGTLLINGVEKFMGGEERVGETVAFGALAGWGYLRPTIQLYQTPVRYVLNLVYGAAIFAFLFPLASHGVVATFQNVDSALHQESLLNTNWLWVVWSVFLIFFSIVPVVLYFRAAWQQGYGLGAWLGSWVPPRGWKIRRGYRIPASRALATFA